MPQEQRHIPCEFVGREPGVAIATGNNAAWLCRCGYAHPLVGRTGHQDRHPDSFSIVCPQCDRAYFVFPEDKDLGRAKQVVEVACG